MSLFAVLAVAGFCASSCFASDTVRDMELRERAARTEAQAFEQQRSAIQTAQRRAFEARFNQLVKAIEGFSIDYNGGKGQVWPQSKAEALRKAMLDLQRQEAAFAAAKEPDRK